MTTPEALQQRFDLIARLQRDLCHASLETDKDARTSAVMLADDELRMALYYLRIDLIRMGLLT